MAKTDDTEESVPKSKGLKPVDKPLTLDYLKKQKKVKHKSLRILLDPDLGDQADEAAKALADAQKALMLNSKSELTKPAELKLLEKAVDDAKKAKEEADDAVYDASVEFKFKSIGRNKMDELFSEHAPTPKQIALGKEEGNSDLQYNPETFPQALVAACLVEPELTEEDVNEIWDDESWSTNEVVSLFVAAQEVNQHFRVVDEKKG